MNQLIKIDNACFVEDTIDFKTIYKKFNTDDSLYIPLDIKTLLLCKKYNVKIFDFNKYLDNDFHFKANRETKKFTETLRFEKQIHYSLRSEIIGALRFRLHSVILIIEIVQFLLNEFKIKKFVVSGIKKRTHVLHYAKICSEIIEELFPDYTYSINDKYLFESDKGIYKYYPKKKILNKEKKICISNGGYNFKRICKLFKSEKFQIILPNFEKITLFKKLIYFIRGIKVVDFYQRKENFIKKQYFIKKINFLYQNKFDLSFLLNNFYEKLNFYFNDLHQKMTSLKIFLNASNFDLLISNISRGLDGSILDSDIKNTTLCIPHGIISKSFTKNDELYKKNIAEGVFNGESKFFAIQSKITEESLQTHKLNGKIIQTGNLVFSYFKKKDNINKKYILYATTLKSFSNLQYLGVDMFYEYWNILEDLNDISKKRGKTILVKIHPQFRSCKKEFKKFFDNLKFSNQRIDQLLHKSYAAIGFSSGAIEDALNSRVPVILYDPKCRYKQMNCYKKENKEKAVNYINKKEELEYILEKIKSVKKFNFESYVYENNMKEVFYDKILPLTKK